jgi:hypothetical protein
MGMKYALATAALILSCYGTMAVAAEEPEHKEKSKVAHQSIAMLEAIGLNHPEIAEFIDYVDQHVDNGDLRIAEEHRMGGMFKLHYQLTGGDVDSKKQIELKFTPDDSHMEYTARPNAVMANYRLKF